jgi:hypothetical protein
MDKIKMNTKKTLKKMNKRGMFFTILVIVMLSIFAASFILYSTFKSRESTQKRIESMNTFLFSVEKDLSREVYISGFRSLMIVEKRIMETGTFSQNVTSSMNELFFNGTINGEQQELMLGATFSDIQNDINFNAEKLNVEVNITNPILQIVQEDPWNVKIILQTHLIMRDRENLASWDKTESTISLISITNFEDPIYTLNTNNLVTNSIIKTPYETFVSGSNIANLSNHATNSYYKASQSAPSFIDRLEGKLSSANTQGIESLVNLQELSNQGISIQQKSAVDYIYFSAGNPGSHHITGMPFWFRLDDAHLGAYNATSLAE